MCSKADTIPLKALQKLYINILWFGFLLMVAGLGVALVRRIREQKRPRKSADVAENDIAPQKHKSLSRLRLRRQNLYKC